jgi:hypothetical protein
MLKSMQLVKKVREAAKLNAWAMHKKMGKKTVQAYLSLERSAKRISLEDLFALEKIWIEEGCGSASDFQDLARKCTKK